MDTSQISLAAITLKINERRLTSATAWFEASPGKKQGDSISTNKLGEVVYICHLSCTESINAPAWQGKKHEMLSEKHLK
jgi:hypothetical protein